jgi:hypothetical protein
VATIIEPTSYRGWSHCWRVSNGDIELVVTADVGPRVIRCGVPGGQNVFKNFEAQLGTSGEAEWMIRGGSRIWIGPEDPVASYAPDNSPVSIVVEHDRLTATAPVEPLVQVQKQMVIDMPSRGASVEVRHRVRNAGLLPAEFAIWVLTVMAPGGTAVTGLPARGTHPEVLAPSNPLVLWAFTDLSDPRWSFLRKYVVLRQDSRVKTPQKIGSFNPDTWGAYLLNGELFVKRCAADRSRAYPDFGCSFETFTNDEMLELETLGPLCRVAPGQWIEHTEHWALHRDVALSAWTDDALDRVVAPLLNGSPG